MKTTTATTAIFRVNKIRSAITQSENPHCCDMVRARIVLYTNAFAGISQPPPSPQRGTRRVPPSRSAISPSYRGVQYLRRALSTVQPYRKLHYPPSLNRPPTRACSTWRNFFRRVIIVKNHFIDQWDKIEDTRGMLPVTKFTVDNITSYWNHAITMVDARCRVADSAGLFYLRLRSLLFR